VHVRGQSAFYSQAPQLFLLLALLDDRHVDSQHPTRYLYEWWPRLHKYERTLDGDWAPASDLARPQRHGLFQGNLPPK
jgi:hypothetical protein